MQLNWLADLALPAGEIPVALLFFNVGVEIGPFMFITALIAAVGLARLLKYPPMLGRTAFLTATYAIGAMASFRPVSAWQHFQSSQLSVRLWPKAAVQQVRNFISSEGSMCSAADTDAT